MTHITIKAMLIARNGEKLLFSHGYDAVKGEAFFRPLGGHVEFGERGEETIRREMKEELGCDVLRVRFSGVIENLFTYRGTKSHEIILAYEGELSDASLYEKSTFTFLEGVEKKQAGWFSKADVEKEGIPIYPPFGYFD